MLIRSFLLSCYQLSLQMWAAASSTKTEHFVKAWVSHSLPSCALPQRGPMGNAILEHLLRTNTLLRTSQFRHTCIPPPEQHCQAPQIPFVSLLSKLTLTWTCSALTVSSKRLQPIHHPAEKTRESQKQKKERRKKKKLRNSDFPLCFCRLFWWAAWNCSLLTCATGTSTQPFFYLLFSKSLWAEATGDRLQCSRATAHPWAGMQHSELPASTEKGAERSTWKSPTTK